MDHLTNPAARDVIGHVLDTHPDGQILLAEAGHWRMIAQQSALVAAEAEAAEKAARRGCQALRHRLDPRNQRTMHVGVATVALAAVGAALLGLDRIEFAVILAGWMASAAAAAATAAWAGCAWLAALAVREERRGRLIAIAAGAVGRRPAAGRPPQRGTGRPPVAGMGPVLAERPPRPRHPGPGHHRNRDHQAHGARFAAGGAALLAPGARGSPGRRPGSPRGRRSGRGGRPGMVQPHRCLCGGLRGRPPGRR